MAVAAVPAPAEVPVSVLLGDDAEAVAMITIERKLGYCNSCGDDVWQEINAMRVGAAKGTGSATTLGICDRCLGELKSTLCVGMVLPAAHARRTDPDTAKLAAASVNVTRGQQVTLDVIRVCFPHPKTFTLDDLLAGASDCLGESDVKWSPSGMRSRCAELVERGKVERCGTTTLPSGRSANLHRLAAA